MFPVPLPPNPLPAKCLSHHHSSRISGNFPMNATEKELDIQLSLPYLVQEWSQFVHCWLWPWLLPWWPKSVQELVWQEPPPQAHFARGQHWPGAVGARARVRLCQRGCRSRQRAVFGWSWRLGSCTSHIMWLERWCLEPKKIKPLHSGRRRGLIQAVINAQKRT